jgi:hypothetical protein
MSEIKEVPYLPLGAQYHTPSDLIAEDAGDVYEERKAQAHQALSEAHEAVRKALEALPETYNSRQIGGAKSSLQFVLNHLHLTAASL